MSFSTFLSDKLDLLSVISVLLLGMGIYLCCSLRSIARTVDPGGAAFDLKSHRFEYAYSKYGHGKPFYLVRFGQTPSGRTFAEGIIAGTMTYVTVYLSQLRRAPSHDLVSKSEQQAQLARILDALAADCHTRAYHWGHDGEVAMAFAAKSIAGHIEEISDRLTDDQAKKIAPTG